MEAVRPRPGLATRPAPQPRPRAGGRGGCDGDRGGRPAGAPADVELRDDPDAFVELVAEGFGERHELPANAAAVVAFVDGKPVSSGRVDLDPDTEFAGLYGGVTLPEYRGRGLYRATVLKRAEIARERGYRWLFVDALPTSRPILERIGFTQLTITTPYVFGRDPAASSSD